MSMDQELAQMYGTHTTQEDMNKVAEAQLFAKLAAANNIDLGQYSDEQVLQLFNETMGKTAEEHCDGCDKPESECSCESAKEEAKVAAAQQEFQVKQEWQEKVAECDKLGRIMAHAYVQELGMIDRAKTASEHEGGEETEEEKKKREEEEAAAASEGKEASAIDQLAARHAVDLAKHAGLDYHVAAQRLDAVLTLGGPAMTEKTASARSLEENVHIRALEFLEAAGYPVTWAQ